MSVGAATIGETLLVAVCALEPGRAAQLLPKPLRAIRDEAYVYVVWATLNSEMFPIRGRSFVEANIALPCEGPDGEGTWFLRAYFPWKDLVRNAYLSGWTGVEAQVEVGRVPRSVQRLVWPPKHAVGGWVAREGRREIELSVVPGESVDLATTPVAKFNRVYGVRTVAGLRDMTLEHHLDDVIYDVRSASAQLQVRGDAAAALGPHRVVGGYLIEFGIVYAGSRSVAWPSDNTDQ